MKHILILIIAMSTLCLYSCKETEDYNSVNSGQDRDSDEITGDNYVYHLPIIFHVFYKDNSDKNKITMSRLQEILSNVNELYEGITYTNMLDTIASENIHVQFELALYDENGNKLGTPGVEYVKYPSSQDSIDCNEFMKGKQYARYMWDPNNYINVMVYNFKQGESTDITLGISNLPYQGAGYPQIEGLTKSEHAVLHKNNLSYPYCVSLNAIFIDKRYEGTRYTTDKNKKQYTYVPLDPNATLAHELGHFLGLKHVFTEHDDKEESKASAAASTDPCEDTDFCEDTPSYDRDAYIKWLINFQEQAKKEKEDTTFTLIQLAKRENNKGEKWQADNMMDYSYCYNTRFTPDQAYRMRQVLYYSPLIPGPKKARTGSRAAMEAPEGPIDLPIVLAKARTVKTNLIKKQ